jgi:outer membrane PBP1 activator LpoA protein
MKVLRHTLWLGLVLLLVSACQLLPQRSDKAREMTPMESFQEAQLALQRNDVDKAAEIARNLAEKDGEHTAAAIIRSQVDVKNGNPINALRRLEAIDASNVTNVYIRSVYHRTVGDAAQMLGDFRRAFQQYLLAQRLMPNPQEKLQDQLALWHMLTGLDRTELLDLRQTNLHEEAQSWIDLALVMKTDAKPIEAVSRWQAAYPRHEVMPEVIAIITGGILPEAENSLPQIQIPNLPNQASNQDVHLSQDINQQDVNQGFKKIAAVLPLQSPRFRMIAEAVQNGIRTAREKDNPKADITFWPTGDQASEIFSAFHEATKGSDFVIGPLNKEAIRQLLGSAIEKPTLTLSVPDQDTAPPPMVYFYGFDAEEEARLVASEAQKMGAVAAMVVTSQEPIAARLKDAFISAWTKTGGLMMDVLPFGVDEVQLLSIRSTIQTKKPDMIFIAASAGPARLVRPYLGVDAKLFATSLVYEGAVRPTDLMDLGDIYFVDCPWLLEPSNPLFTSFSLPSEYSQNALLLRFYALGADAYALAKQYPYPPNFVYEGLTGKLHLDGQRFVRELPLAKLDSQNGLVIIHP